MIKTSASRSRFAVSLAVVALVAAVLASPASAQNQDSLQTDTIDITGVVGSGPYPNDGEPNRNRFGASVPVNGSLSDGQFAGWVYATMDSEGPNQKIRVSCIEHGKGLPENNGIELSASTWDDLRPNSVPASKMANAAWLAGHPTYRKSHGSAVLDTRRLGTPLSDEFGRYLDSLRGSGQQIGTAATVRSFEAAALQIALWNVGGLSNGDPDRYAYPATVDARIGAPIRQRIESLTATAKRSSSSVAERPARFEVSWHEGPQDDHYRVHIQGVTSTGKSPIGGATVAIKGSSTVTTDRLGYAEIGLIEPEDTVEVTVSLRAEAGTVLTPKGDYQQLVSLDPFVFSKSLSFTASDGDGVDDPTVPETKEPTTTTTVPSTTTTTTTTPVEGGDPSDDPPQATDPIVPQKDPDVVPDELPHTGTSVEPWVVGMLLAAASAVAAGTVVHMRRSKKQSAAQ